MLLHSKNKTPSAGLGNNLNFPVLPVSSTGTDVSSLIIVDDRTILSPVDWLFEFERLNAP